MSTSPPIQAYIENAYDSGIGGFTIPLPVTKEALQPWMEAIEAPDFQQSDIAVVQVKSNITELDQALYHLPVEEINFDELNYLAAKIQGLDADQMERFEAALEAGWSYETVPDLINLTENLHLLDLQPAFSVEEYGDFLHEIMGDEHAAAIGKLLDSRDSDLIALAGYIEKLEKSVDSYQLAHNTVQEEQGKFTDKGYVTCPNDLTVVYRGLQDIPTKLCIFTAPEPPLMAKDVELPSFLVQLHAILGDYAHDIRHNLNVLTDLRSAEYLLLMDGTGAFLTSSAHVYRHDTDAHTRWMAAEDAPSVQGFAIHITEVHGRIAGDVVQVDIRERQRDIEEHTMYPIRIDAQQKLGPDVSFTPEQWNAMDAIDRDQLQSWTRQFEPDAFHMVNRHLEQLGDRDAKSCKTIDSDQLLLHINKPYMEQCKHPQPDMLRIPHAIAKEMLTHGDAIIFRLLPEGAKQLSPLDAMQSRGGLWFSEHRDFAIRKSDLPTLEKWAQREVKVITAPVRENLPKTKEQER